MKLEFGLQTREELDEASAIMARAYEDYDYVTLYFRDAEKSRKGVQIFMNCVLKANYGKADLLAAHRDGKLVARATLEAPGFKKPSAFQYIIHGFWRVYLNTKWSEINGFVAMDEGASTKTSQVNMNEYLEYFGEFLEQGKDILFRALSAERSLPDAGKLSKDSMFCPAASEGIPKQPARKPSPCRERDGPRPNPPWRRGFHPQP